MAKSKSEGAKADGPLHMQMVPFSLWGRNIRALIGGRVHWKRVREALLAKQGLRCATCGKVVVEPRALKAHEEWTYLERTEPAVAWLRRISLVCFHCHAVEHPGALNAMISEGTLSERARTDTIAHFCAVNGVTKRRWNAQLRAAYRDFDRRSSRRWYVDYGPFTEWVVASYENDPLNREPWPEHLEKRWGGDHPLPSMESIVASFKAPSAETYPGSPHGFLAQLLEVNAAKKTAERRRKALKRKREKLRAAKEAAKVSQERSRPSEPPAIEISAA